MDQQHAEKHEQITSTINQNTNNIQLILQKLNEVVLALNALGAKQGLELFENKWVSKKRLDELRKGDDGSNGK